MSAPFERGLLLPHLLGQRADERPDDVILQDPGGAQFTNRQMQQMMLRWAGGLARLGVGPGDCVATMMPNRPEAFGGWLGTGWLRAIEVPINTAYRGRMLHHVIHTSTARVMIVDRRFVDRLAEVVADVPLLETVVVVDDAVVTEPLPDLPFAVMGVEQFLAEGVDVAAEPGPDAWDISCMLFTSGTTGPSKGVLVPWRSLYEFPTAIPASCFEEGRGIYIVLPLFHVSGKQALWSAALYRCRLVTREAFSLSQFWDDIVRFDCCMTGLIGSMATLVYRHPDAPPKEESPLRAVAMGPMIPELNEFHERFGVQVISGFGMTEAGVSLGTGDVDVNDWRTCGRVRPGYQVRIVDEHDHPLGPGEIGEFVVRTEEPWMLMAGYFNLPDKTAAAWRNGWFHTGDAMTYDEDGNFFFVDRIKDAIRRRGENISSFEVEGYVGEHPAVMESAAIAVPSDLTEDDVKIVVVLKPDAGLTADELYSFLEGRMPRFMVPRYIEIVDSLPKTPTTRVKKNELRDQPLGPSTWDAHRERTGVR